MNSNSFLCELSDLNNYAMCNYLWIIYSLHEMMQEIVKIVIIPNLY